MREVCFIGNHYRMVHRINAACGVVQEQSNSLISDVVGGSMRKRMVIRNFPAQIKGETTDTIIGETVCNNDRYLRRRISLACSKGGTDTCITAAQNQHS